MVQNSTVDRLTVSIPRSLVDDRALDNLRALVKSKEHLIEKALGADSLEIIADEETIAFPWFRADAENGTEIYADFINALCRIAGNLTRVNSGKEKKVENEKYAFRCFLIRLGFVGSEYKKHRRVLLSNLEGSSAFRNGRKNEEVNA